MLPDMDASGFACSDSRFCNRADGIPARSARAFSEHFCETRHARTNDPTCGMPGYYCIRFGGLQWPVFRNLGSPCFNINNLCVILLGRTKMLEIG